MRVLTKAGECDREDRTVVTCRMWNPLALRPKGEVGGTMGAPQTHTPHPIFPVCVGDGVLNSETVMLQVQQAEGLDHEISLKLLRFLWKFQGEPSNRHLGK